MNSKKYSIIFALNIFTKQLDGEKKEVNQFLFTTPFGLLFGKLSNSTEVYSSSKSLNLKFAISTFNDSLKEKQVVELEPILQNDCLILKEVTLIAPNGNKFYFDSYILFYEHIIGVTLAPLNFQDTVI